MGVVVSIRQESAVAQESEVTVRYCISLKVLNAKELLNASRSHLIGHLVKMFAVNRRQKVQRVLQGADKCA
ncbi:glysosyl-transferase [Vibrio cholerae]|nr:glysosyl-transferase [Vibrio cholerae]